jgi:hypothetical protein
VIAVDKKTSRLQVSPANRHVRRVVREAVSLCESHGKPAGYAIIVWDKSGEVSGVHWHTGGAMPARLVPEYIRSLLEAAVNAGRVPA